MAESSVDTDTVFRACCCATTVPAREMRSVKRGTPKSVVMPMMAITKSNSTRLSAEQLALWGIMIAELIAGEETRLYIYDCNYNNFNY